MNKITQKNLHNTSGTGYDGALFLGFCRALEKYCDSIGISNPKFSAVRILHDAAYNTVAAMQTVTPAQHIHMDNMARNIPDMFDGLIKIITTHGPTKTINDMSAMTLDELAAAIAKNSYNR